MIWTRFGAIVWDLWRIVFDEGWCNSGCGGARSDVLVRLEEDDELGNFSSRDQRMNDT